MTQNGMYCWHRGVIQLMLSCDCTDEDCSVKAVCDAVKALVNPEAKKVPKKKAGAVATKHE